MAYNSFLYKINFMNNITYPTAIFIWIRKFFGLKIKNTANNPFLLNELQTEQLMNTVLVLLAPEQTALKAKSN